MDKKTSALFDTTCVAIRDYLNHCGWKDYDAEMLTNNMMFVIDPITSQNVPINYAYTIQTTRQLMEVANNVVKKT